MDELKIPKYLKDTLSEISTLCNTLMVREDKLNKTLPQPVYYEWNISLNLVVPVMLWLDGSDWTVISQHTHNMFEGNFIKDMLRLCNVFRNLSIVASINNDTDLLSKISNIEEKVLKDIVTTESLYVN
jgi:superfamily II RNA helicase